MNEWLGGLIIIGTLFNISCFIVAINILDAKRSKNE